MISSHQSLRLLVLALTVVAGLILFLILGNATAEKNIVTLPGLDEGKIASISGPVSVTVNSQVGQPSATPFVLSSQSGQLSGHTAASENSTFPAAKSSRPNAGGSQTQQRTKDSSRDLLSSESQSENQSESTKFSGQIRKSLNLLRKIITDQELLRSHFEVHNFSESVYSKVTISRPGHSEIMQLNKIIADTLPTLPENARPFFLVDAKRMVDRYTHFTRNYLVLIVALSQHTNADGIYHGSYWEYLTDNPENYKINSAPSLSAYGRVIAPSGISTSFSKQWIGDNFKPPDRYSHLFQ